MEPDEWEDDELWYETWDDPGVIDILWEAGQCMNCGCWATADPDHPGEYHCENCGDIWDVNEPVPQIP